ncbi:MAG: hypothetical protein JWM10_2661 [Myxococcaceae bacterium]|nr:hypothetical protein [Myxococcaceae bacterium]
MTPNGARLVASRPPRPDAHPMSNAEYAEAASRLLDVGLEGAATARVCQDLVEFLSHFIGDSGSGALFERSLLLTRREHPWLAAPGEAPVWARLGASLDDHAPAAYAAAHALVATYIRLFATFVGTSLAFEILHQHRPGAFPLAAPEESV